MVVKLTEDGFWMAPDGFFRGESIYTKTFADVKLSCLGSAPDSASPASMFTPDWAHVIANVDHLRNAIATTGSLKQGLLTASNSNSSIKMKFTHKLFEVCSFCFVLCFGLMYCSQRLRLLTRMTMTMDLIPLVLIVSFFHFHD